MANQRRPMRDPRQLAAGLQNNQQLSGAMQNIYAGNRMMPAQVSGNPQMFSGRTPPRTIPQSQQVMQPLARQAPKQEDPWGEGKPWATYDQWNQERKQAFPNQFDWSSDNNTPEAIANQRNIERMAAEGAGRIGAGYQTPDVIQNALNKAPNDPSMANFGRWSEQDYKDHGYALQDPTDVQKKFGINVQQWVKQPPQAPAQQTAPQASQSVQNPAVSQQAQEPDMSAYKTMPAQSPPEQTAQNPAFGATMPAQQNFTGKGGQQMPPASNSPQSLANGLQQQQQMAAAMGKGGKGLPKYV